MLKISSRVTTYLEVIISLGVTNFLKMTFLLGLMVSLAEITYFIGNICVKVLIIRILGPKVLVLVIIMS